MKSFNRRVNALMTSETSSCVLDKIAKLANVSTNNPNRRLKDLYKVIKRRDFLHIAYQEIRKNSGSKTAGVDHVTRNRLDDPEELHFVLKSLSESISSGNYQPLPVRRVEIPKGFGKKGTRPLGIPALKDRIVQSAIKIVLESIFETSFSEASHGFRPYRGCQTVVADIHPKGYDWVIEGDIKGCFDNIKHGILLEILRKKIADERFIQLINKFLKSGYQMGFGIDGKTPVFATKDGTPQGGIMSPVLANIYLNEFDRFVQNKIDEVKVDKQVKKDAVYEYLQNKKHNLSKAIKRDIYPYKMQWKGIDSFQREEESKRTFETLDELEKGLQEVTEMRKRFKRATDEYNNLQNTINRIRQALRLKKVPFTTIVNENGESSRGKVIMVKNRREAAEQIDEINKLMSKMGSLDKNDYFQKKTIGYARYADNFVVLLKNYSKEETKKLKDEISEWFMNHLRLEISEEKTKITHATDGFVFVGYEIKKTTHSTQGKKIGFGFSKIYVPNEKVSRVKEKLNYLMNIHRNSSFADLIRALNQVIIGWSNYYKLCNNWYDVSRKLDHWLYWEILHWLAKKHKSTIPKMIQKYLNKNSTAFGQKKRQRFVAPINDTKYPLRQFKDTKYTLPIDIANSIKDTKEVETWYFSEIDDTAISKTIAEVYSGYSHHDRIESEKETDKRCMRCGNKSEKLVLHHMRLVRRGKKKRAYDKIQSSRDIKKVLICEDCHKEVHLSNDTISQ
jgi:retron-type reverse transcriptase